MLVESNGWRSCSYPENHPFITGPRGTFFAAAGGGKEAEPIVRGQILSNSARIAEHWVCFLAQRPEIKGAAHLLEHFRAGTISRLCDCRCQSFDLVVPSDARVEPLLPAGAHGGCVLSIAFRAAAPVDTIEFDIFADKSGRLAGVDVGTHGNGLPLPDNVVPIEPPYHVHGPLAAIAR